MISPVLCVASHACFRVVASFLPPFCNSSLETPVEINSSDHCACNPRCSAKDMLAGVHPDTRSPCISSPGACMLGNPTRATVAPGNCVSTGGESIKAKHRARARLERMLVVAAGTALSPIRAHAGIPDRTSGLETQIGLTPSALSLSCLIPDIPSWHRARASPCRLGCLFSRDAYVAWTPCLTVPTNPSRHATQSLLGGSLQNFAQPVFHQMRNQNLGHT